MNYACYLSFLPVCHFDQREKSVSVCREFFLCYLHEISPFSRNDGLFDYFYFFISLSISCKSSFTDFLPAVCQTTFLSGEIRKIDGNIFN